MTTKPEHGNERKHVVWEAGSKIKLNYFCFVTMTNVFLFLCLIVCLNRTALNLLTQKKMITYADIVHYVNQNIFDYRC